MRKLIWCAAAGAVAAGSAWATVYAWNHRDAMARGTLASTCVVGLVNKVHVPNPKAPATGAAAAPAWTDLPAGRPNEVAPTHELKLDMPIVIRETDDVVKTEESKVLDGLNHGYEDERLAILEQLRPLMSDIVNAEIVAGSGKSSDDTVCPQPMPYCVDEEEDINVVDPVPVMPYATDEHVSTATVLAVGEMLWAVPFLGDPETTSPGWVKVVEETTSDLELSIQKALLEDFPYPLQDCRAAKSPSPEEKQAVEQAVALVTESVTPSYWLSWVQSLDVAPELPDGTEEAEPKSPEEESYHYHDHDLSCPYSGCPYPGGYQRMPEPPVEESEPKKAGEKAKEPEKTATAPGVAIGVVAGSAPDNALQNLASDHLNNYSATPTPLPLSSTRPEEGGFYLTAGVVVYHQTNPLQYDINGIGARLDGTAPTQTGSNHFEDFVKAVKSYITPAQAADLGTLFLPGLTQRVKEMLSDYVHMVNDDRGAYCEDPVIMPPDRPETKEPMKATTDTLEFRLSDHASYEDDDDTGPF